MFGGKKDGGKIGGSRVHFPLHTGETPSRSIEEQSEQPTAPSVYEDRRRKSTKDTEKTDGKGTASGQKGPWDQCRDPGNCNPGPVQELGLPQDSWERAGLMSPSPAKQGLSSTKRDLVA